MKNVIITGATGGIGVSLINILIKNNINVLALVKENSKRINNIPKNEKVTLLECNLSDINKLILTKNYDAFIHLGWDGTFGTSREDMYLQLKNIEYTLDAVNLASRSNCKLFLGVGSQAELGFQTTTLSDFTIPNPTTGYGIAKLTSNFMSKNLCNKLAIKHIWIRLLSVYGPYDGDKTMIMQSIKSLLENKSLTYSSATQTWDYLYVDDAAMYIYLLLTKGENNYTYHVASNTPRPLKEYIKDIHKIINSDILPIFSKNKINLVNLSADTKKLINDTNYLPQINFEEGIKRTLKYIKESSNNEKN